MARAICVLLVAAAIGVAPVLGGEPMASAERNSIVGGSVTDVHGEPAGGVCVGLVDAQGHWVALTETLDDGSYVVWTGGSRGYGLHVIADSCTDLVSSGPRRYVKERSVATDGALDIGGVVAATNTRARWVLTTSRNDGG